MKTWRIALMLSWMFLASDVTAQEATALDPATGLVKAPGWEMVRAHCSGCHSTRLVTQQRADKKQWLALIRWMQAEQNLWPIPAPIEEDILNYLAHYYAAPKAQRRVALPRSQQPRNPYAPATSEPVEAKKTLID